MPGSPFIRSRERDMSIAVYAGGRSNGSPSPEAKPDLDGATLMLMLLARNTQDPCEILVVRMLRDRPTTARSVGSRVGAGKENGSLSRSRVATRGRRKHSEDGCWIVNVVEATRGYRNILEKAVIVATREFFDSVAGKKAGHEMQATTKNPNVSPRAGMLERHRSISGVASEVCRRAATLGVPDERELEEGRPFEDNTPMDKSEGHHRRGKNLMG
ncbi:hypothetical protein EDB89DRAFT_2243788 [Lactarius sanguifluus]|nr:hypothetical protein EDB89DRAFT_2243788 [Lactarius sanguifluus]